jgi:hypothetical protein
MIWLGKFYSEFFWSAWLDVSESGVKSLFKFWNAVDALNLVLIAKIVAMCTFAFESFNQLMMTVLVAFRLRFVLFVSNNPLKVPTNR